MHAGLDQDYLREGLISLSGGGSGSGGGGTVGGNFHRKVGGAGHLTYTEGSGLMLWCFHSTA